MTQTDTQGAIARTDLSEVLLEGPLKNLEQAWAIARVLAQSTMVPRALQGSPQNCLITMMLGQELGLSWTQATRAIYVLPSGQPGLRGQFLLARIRNAGHRYRFVETDDACEFIVTRKDEEFKNEYKGTFTTERAKRAGLVTEDKNGNLVARSNSGQPLPWEQYREDMLKWRAVARGAGIGCPELSYGFDIGGVGETGDAGSVVTAEVLPQPSPANGQQPADMRDKLAELDRQHAEYVGDPLPKEDAEPIGETAGAADYEVERAPGLPDLQELLRRSGYTGAAQARTANLMVPREIGSMDQLTPGEIFMVHDAVKRVTLGEPTMHGRHEAVEQYLHATEADEHG
jgi:hypothetical protein